MEIMKIRETVIRKVEEKGKLELKPVVKCLLSFLGGLIMMNPFVLGQYSPFAISLVCTLQGSLSVWAGAGGIIGSFLFFKGTTSIKYVTVILFAILIKSTCVRISNNFLSDNLAYINSFGSTFVIGIAIMLATGFNSDECIGIFYEALLASGGAYIFGKSAHIIWSNKEISRYTTEETSAILLVVGIILMHFYRYKLFQLSPVVTVFIAAVIVAARIRNGYGGTLCGVCTGFTLGLSRDAGFICLGIALGGLLCGELNRRNKYFGALGFILPVCLCAVADGSLTSYMAIAESIIVCSVSLIVPESFFIYMCKKVNAPVPVIVRTDDNNKLSKKLNEASGVITHVSDCVNKVQHTLKPATDEQLNRYVKRAWEKVCRNCELNESCRSEIKKPSDETIRRLANALHNHAELDETRFPKGFYVSCYSFNEMQTEMHSKYLEYIANQSAQAQIEQVNSLMSDQFKSMADILHDLACEFNDEINVDSETAEQCADEAREFGLEVISTDSYLDRFGRLFVTLNIKPPNNNFIITKFTENLSSAIGTALDLPELEETENSVMLKFSQKLSYDICVGAFSRPTETEQVCGDYFRSFRDDNGRYIVLLSDGMGTGSRAAIDSAMAAELFSKLIKAGLSFDCALSISNSAMLVKSSDESLATLDTVCIDLYTGKTEFMKAGAAATFVRHKGNVAQLEQASLPIGILRDVKFTKAVASLERGDIILMISDGILGECNGWIQQELKLWQSDNSPQALAEFIVDSACERKLAKHRDDMTAIAIYIE